MSREIATAVQGPFHHAWSLVMAFMDTCPDTVWAEKNGGWPVWQQMGHAVMVLDFFTKGEQDFLPAPFDVPTGMLKQQGQGVVSRAAMKNYAATVKARVDQWLAGLADADLAVSDTVVTKAIGRETTKGSVLVMLASHTDYHVGSCDAALRDNDLPGVF